MDPPWFFHPVLSSRLHAFTSGHFTDQLHFSVSVSVVPLVLLGMEQPRLHWGRGGSSQKPPQPHWCPLPEGQEMSKAVTVMWMLSSAPMVCVFHNTWSWWHLRLPHLSWPSCCNGGTLGFCQGKNSLLSFLGLSYKRLMRCWSFMHLVAHFARA